MGHLKDLDVGWCGGLFDGEGTIRIHKADSLRRKSYVLKTSLSMSSHDCVKLFHKLVGTGSIYSDPKQKSKGMWQWIAHGRDALFMLKLLEQAIRLKRLQLLIAYTYMEECYTGLVGRFNVTEVQLARSEELYQQLRLLNKVGKHESE